MGPKVVNFTSKRSKELMIVDNLHIIGVAIVPSKTNSPLFVDANTVPTLAVSFKCFQVVTRRAVQVGQQCGAIKLPELPLRDSFKRPKPGHAFPLVKKLCVSATKAFNHPSNV
jgi:hypothetical protein